MNFLKQLGMLLRLNLLAIPQRLGLACTTVLGVTCAVGVLIAMLAMAVGAQREAMGNVRPDRASLLSIGAAGPDQSNIPKEVAAIIGDLPGIRRNASGQPIAVPQASLFVQARRKDDGNLVGFPVTGTGARLIDYAPELRLTAGRMFRPGLHELIANNTCAHQYQNFNVGDDQLIQGVTWSVVGNFDLGRSNGSCTVYADADTVLSAFRRNSYNEVLVVLRSPAAFDQLVNATKSNPLLNVRVEHEADLANAGIQQVTGTLNFISYFVGAVLALAATVGAANSLYALVDSRQRELATLRAIGFSGAPVVASTLIEAIFLAIPGALIGTLLAWIFFNGLTARPFGFQFHLAVTPSLVLLGIGWALCMGLLGGLLPAARASRVPVAAQFNVL